MVGVPLSETLPEMNQAPKEEGPWYLESQTLDHPRPTTAPKEEL
jgi:hypothetical protein